MLSWKILQLANQGANAHSSRTSRARAPVGCLPSVPTGERVQAKDLEQLEQDKEPNKETADSSKR